MSLATTKENEAEILAQIENDYDCISAEIDTSIDLDVFETETKCKNKDLETLAATIILFAKQFRRASFKNRITDDNVKNKVT